MVLCLLALPVFAVFSIFSIKYRKLTLEALDCLFRTATLRKCKSGLDERIRASVTGKVLKFSPRSAELIYKHYKLISWIVLLIFLWSIYEGSIGMYNYARYGNCNGPADIGFCIFDPTGENSKISLGEIDIQSKIVYPTIDKDDPIIGNKNARLTIIEFGCYACYYTKKAELILDEVLEHYKDDVNLQFKTFYSPHQVLGYKSALAADCADEQGKYYEYHKLLFKFQENMSEETFSKLAENLDLNLTQFDECYKQEKYKNEVNADTLMGVHAGVIGTPTFFINQQKIVGAKPFQTFKLIIDEELKK